MASDRPGLIMRQHPQAMLKQHNDPEVTRNEATAGKLHEGELTNNRTSRAHGMPT